MPANPPNIVVIISDDQGYDDYGFMGHEQIKTPRIDKLASESLWFKRGYVTTALCCPSLTTMVTGLYPHQHGYTGNDPVYKSPTARVPWVDHFSQLPQLPAMLQERGYLSLHTGKYWQGDPAISGFTDTMGETHRHGSAASLGIGRDGMQPIYDFIAKAQTESKPFLVWYAPFMPHTPHTPPERLLNKYAGSGHHASYFAMCEWLDETCGQLLDHLDEQGLTDNTIIVYICDNGWPIQSKASPSEQGIRTPILIKWPGQIRPHMDDINLASNLDLAPTILAACGLEPAPEMPGINLLDNAAVYNRTTLFAENYMHDMVDLDSPVASLRARSCINKKWKLTIWQDQQPDFPMPAWQWSAPKDTVELFNLKDDPKEKKNLAKENPEIVATMLKQLNHWWNPNSRSENP